MQNLQFIFCCKMPRFSASFNNQKGEIMSRFTLALALCFATQAQAVPQDQPGYIVGRCAHYGSPRIHHFGPRGRVIYLTNAGKYGTIVPEAIKATRNLGGALANSLPDLPRNFFAQEILFFFSTCSPTQSNAYIVKCSPRSENFIRLIGQDGSGMAVSYDIDLITQTSKVANLRLDIVKVQSAVKAGYNIQMIVKADNLSGPAQQAFDQLTEHLNQTNDCQ